MALYSDSDLDSESESVEVEIENVNDPKEIMVNENGVEADVFNNFSSNIQSQLNLLNCDICGKFYKEDMMAPFEGLCCYHCFFWMNYAPESRKQVDGVNGLSIVDYILKCKDNHAMGNCAKVAIGACLICDLKMGEDLGDIKDKDKLYKTVETVETNEKEEKTKKHSQKAINVDNVGDFVIHVKI